MFFFGKFGLFGSCSIPPPGAAGARALPAPARIGGSTEREEGASCAGFASFSRLESARAQLPARCAQRAARGSQNPGPAACCMSVSSSNFQRVQRWGAGLRAWEHRAAPRLFWDARFRLQHLLRSRARAFASSCAARGQKKSFEAHQHATVCLHTRRRVLPPVFMLCLAFQRVGAFTGVRHTIF